MYNVYILRYVYTTDMSKFLFVGPTRYPKQPKTLTLNLQWINGIPGSIKWRYCTI